MRKVGIRQFQQNFHKELKQLPFVVTKDGNDYCVVTPLTAINDIAKMLRPDNVTTTYKAPVRDTSELDTIPDDRTEYASSSTGRCEMPNAACKGIGYAYSVTFQTDEGETTNEYFLCDNHLANARKKYKVKEI